MKKIIFAFIIIAENFSFSQSPEEGLRFINDVRKYYNTAPLEIDETLTAEAQNWANQIAISGDFRVSDNEKVGENIYSVEKTYIKENNKNPFLEAAIAWVLDWEEISTFSQALWPESKRIGFGISEDDQYIYLVAWFDARYK